VQVGDLVELSACGKKLIGFRWLRGYQGIVIKNMREFSVWKVHWFGKPATVMNRKDIKHVKAKKTLDKPANL